MNDLSANARSGDIADYSVSLRSSDDRPMPGIAELLHVGRLSQLGVELTTSCNLACVYCHFAPLDRRGNNASADLVDRIVEFARDFPIDIITLSGDAEITMYNGWEAVAQRLLDAGCNLRSISNFTNGIFKPAEVEAFSRFTEILVSLDTADAELLKKTRYRADLRTMTLNVQQIRAKCIEEGRPQPRLVCNAVIHDKNLGLIDKLAAFTIANGFDVLSLQRYVSLDEVPGGKNDFFDNPNAIQLYPILTLDDAGALAALQAYQRMLNLVEGKIELIVNPAMGEDILRLLNRFEQSRDPGTAGEDAVGLPKSGRQELADGRVALADGRTVTKACLMPWNYLHVMWDGNVPPCCIVKEGFVGNAGDRPIAEIFNAAEMREYREGLLTGRLKPVCAGCTYVPETDTTRLQHMVRSHLASIGQPVAPPVPQP